MSKPAWLEVAFSYLGLSEVHGTKHNPLIVKMFQRIKLSGIKDDETAWCAAFVGSCLEECGIRSTRSAAALSYADYGQKLVYPVEGSIGYKRRFNSAGKVIGGHVFFVAGQDQLGRIMALGGNQGDKVSLAPYEKTGIVGYRYPALQFASASALPVIASDGKILNVKES